MTIKTLSTIGCFKPTVNTNSDDVLSLCWKLTNQREVAQLTNDANLVERATIEENKGWAYYAQVKP